LNVSHAAVLRDPLEERGALFPRACATTFFFGCRFCVLEAKVVIGDEWLVIGCRNLSDVRQVWREGSGRWLWTMGDGRRATGDGRRATAKRAGARANSARDFK